MPTGVVPHVTSPALPVSPRIFGSRMWLGLSMRLSLTSSPCQFGPFNRIAASADQLSTPMCAGSKPGHDAVAVERVAGRTQAVRTAAFA